jgi:hypothetical protein
LLQTACYWGEKKFYFSHFILYQRTSYCGSW